MALAWSMVNMCDFETKTVTPGRWWLAENVDVHLHSIPRYLRALRHAGLLGLVAPGRQARYCPEDSEEHTRYPREGVDRHGDRSVYVLCAPLTEAELAERAEEELGRMENKCRITTFMDRFKLAVDVSATPLPSTAKRNPRSSYEWASPTLKSHFEAAARYVAKQDAARTDLSWPRSATTSAPDEATTRSNELQAARSLQWDIPALAKMRTTTLASIIRPCLRADWTVNDIKHALDHKPDGSRHKHDGFHGMEILAIGIKHRLGFWRLNGQPIYSQSQRVVMNAEEARDRAIAASQRQVYHSPGHSGQRGLCSGNLHAPCGAPVGAGTGKLTFDMRGCDLW